MAKLIDGRKIANRTNKTTKKLVNQLDFQPLLAVILVKTDNARINKANQLYCNMKARKAKRVGIASKTYVLPKQISQKQLEIQIQALNQNPKVTGILVQLPLPKQIDEDKIEELISPSKDVDGVNPVNIGKLATNVDKSKSFYPTGCTPTGIIHMLNAYFGTTPQVKKTMAQSHISKTKAIRDQFFGKRAVVLGRSNIVGRPLVLMLINRGCEVTVLNHEFGLRKDLKRYTKNADIIISATGHYHTLISKDISQTNPPILIDAGENTDPHTHKLCGDISQPTDSFSQAYSTCPGGVGPNTISTLLRQTYQLAKNRP